MRPGAQAAAAAVDSYAIGIYGPLVWKKKPVLLTAAGSSVISRFFLDSSRHSPSPALPPPPPADLSAVLYVCTNRYYLVPRAHLHLSVSSATLSTTTGSGKGQSVCLGIVLLSSCPFCPLWRGASSHFPLFLSLLVSNETHLRILAAFIVCFSFASGMAGLRFKWRFGTR